MSKYDAFNKLTNISMCDPNHFISKLPIEVQTPWAIGLYDDDKSFSEIAMKCNKVYKHLLLSRTNKHPSLGSWPTAYL